MLLSGTAALWMIATAALSPTGSAEKWLAQRFDAARDGGSFSYRVASETPVEVGEDHRFYLAVGAGHANVTPRLITIERDDDVMHVTEFTWLKPAKDSGIFPESNFDTLLRETTLPLVRYTEIWQTIDALRRTKIFRVQPTAFHPPLDPRTGTPHPWIEESSSASWTSSHDFLVAMDYPAAAGFRFNFAGYDGQDVQPTAFLPRTIAAVLIDALDKVRWTTVVTPTPAHRQLFSEHFQLLKQDMAKNVSWWWVRERLLAMTSRFGTAAEIPAVGAWLSAPQERTCYLAATALAGLTGKDRRFDAKKRVLPLAKIRAAYTKDLGSKIDFSLVSKTKITPCRR